MEQREIKALVISALVIAVAFTIAFADGMYGLASNISVLPLLFAISLFTVSISFICHELGHKFVSMRMGYYAEYRMWLQGLVMALLFSLFGFVFAAPGAVYIHPRRGLWGEYEHMNNKTNGVISASGPAVNLMLASLFFAIAYFVPSLAFVAGYGITINAWLAAFNLIPFGPLDGKKVFVWNKIVWLTEIGLAALMFALLYI